MKSIVLELQQEATNSQTQVSSILRKALVVATKLKVDDFEKWIRKELNGYDTHPIPEYRNIKGEVKAYNPYNGYWMPVMFKDGYYTEKLSSRYINQPISGLEDLLSKPGEKGMLTIPFSHDILTKVFPKSISDGIVPQLVISRAHIVSVVDAVRNIVLEWSLKLEKDGILGEGLTFSEKEKEKASSTNYNIQNFIGILGNVNAEKLQIGDYNAIHGELKSKGVSQKERNELEEILDNLKTAKPKKSIITRGKGWLKRNAPIIGPALFELIKKWIENAS